MFKIFRNVILGAVLASVAGAAVASGEKAIKARKGYMQVLAFQMGQLGGMAKGKAPYDAAKATTAAKNLALAAAINTGPMWVPGTDNVAMKGKTRALPKIWEAGSTAADKHQDMVKATAKLAEVAGNGQEALAAAFGPVGKSCGGCHKPYRGPKN